MKTHAHSAQEPTDALHNPDSENHFEVLGLPRRLVVDTGELSRKYYEFSRMYHPDRHQNANVSDRIAAINRTASVNKAFQVLKDPFQRGMWWLEENGEELGRDNNTIPSELIMLVFEIQDLLEQARSDTTGNVIKHVRRHREDVERERRERFARLDDLYATWDERDLAESPELLGELKALLSELSYLRTLLRDVDRTLESVSET